MLSPNSSATGIRAPHGVKYFSGCDPKPQRDLACSDTGCRRRRSRRRAKLVQWAETRPGDEFVVSVAEAFSRLQQDPERYRMLYRSFRRLLVERFPYGI